MFLRRDNLQAIGLDNSTNEKTDVWVHGKRITTSPSNDADVLGCTFMEKCGTLLTVNY